MKKYRTKQPMLVAKKFSDVIYNVILPAGSIVRDKFAGWWYVSEDEHSVIFDIKSVENNPEYFELISE